MSLNSLPGMNQVVTTNGIEVWIRQKWEGVSGLLTKVARIFGTIYADGDGTNSNFIESTQVLLNAPQLGVTQRSPIPTIEDQQHALRWLVIDRLGKKLGQ